MNEQISGTAERNDLCPTLSPTGPSCVPEKPFVPQFGAEPRQFACQICGAAGTRFNKGLLLGVVTPFAGIFEVHNLMTQLKKSQDILKIIPEHSPERKSGDQPGYNNTKLRPLHSVCSSITAFALLPASPEIAQS